jgi:hypothetical protein
LWALLAGWFWSYTSGTTSLLFARAYATSAIPAMRINAVRPYHQVLVFVRFAERTAARRRFEREEDFATGT